MKSLNRSNAEEVQINFRIKKSGKIAEIEINSNTFENEIFARQWVNSHIYPQQIDTSEIRHIKLVSLIGKPRKNTVCPF